VGSSCEATLVCRSVCLYKQLILYRHSFQAPVCCSHAVPGGCMPTITLVAGEPAGARRYLMISSPFSCWMASSYEIRPAARIS